jgi:hypothetical protein
MVNLAFFRQMTMLSIFLLSKNCNVSAKKAVKLKRKNQKETSNDKILRHAKKKIIPLINK